MKQKFRLENEKGSVTVIAVVLLFLLTILGMAAISTSSIETQIAGNELRYKQAFYAAESAAAYVAWRPDLYGSANITSGTPHFFPNNSNPYAPQFAPGAADPINAAGPQTYDGQVSYSGSTSPPRGSGYTVGPYRAHQYQMVCNGYSSNNAFESLRIGFYRIGF